MRHHGLPAFFAVLLVALAAAPRMGAQAVPTATQGLELSAFGGVAGRYTNLLGGKNLGITAGADLAFPAYRGFRPVAELRGSYPVHGGTIDRQRELLGGLRVERLYRNYHPYVDFLAGRGQIDYQRGGFAYGPFIYLSSTTAVYSGGVGVDVDVTRHWSARVDFQVQHWGTPFPPVVASPSARLTARMVPAALGRAFPAVIGVPLGSAPQTIYPKVITFAAVYRFDFNHRYRRRR